MCVKHQHSIPELSRPCPSQKINVDFLSNYLSDRKIIQCGSIINRRKLSNILNLRGIISRWRALPHQG